jgi:F-type H+-transporting ATPase subunit b
MVLLAFQEVRLVPDGTLFIHIALILLMIWVLNRTFFRPVNRVLDARERSKGGRSSEAREILSQVSEKQSQYDRTMLKARSEGYELIERERAEAVAVRQEKVSAVKEEAAQTVARETEELNRQTVEARAAIALQAEQMAEKISSNILKTTY